MTATTWIHSAWTAGQALTLQSISCHPHDPAGTVVISTLRNVQTKGLLLHPHCQQRQSHDLPSKEILVIE